MGLTGLHEVDPLPAPVNVPFLARDVCVLHHAAFLSQQHNPTRCQPTTSSLHVEVVISPYKAGIRPLGPQVYK